MGPTDVQKPLASQGVMLGQHQWVQAIEQDVATLRQSNDLLHDQFVQVTLGASPVVEESSSSPNTASTAGSAPPFSRDLNRCRGFLGWFFQSALVFSPQTRLKLTILLCFCTETR